MCGGWIASISLDNGDKSHFLNPLWPQDSEMSPSVPRPWRAFVRIATNAVTHLFLCFKHFPHSHLWSESPATGSILHLDVFNASHCGLCLSAFWHHDKHPGESPYKESNYKVRRFTWTRGFRNSSPWYQWLHCFVRQHAMEESCDWAEGFVSWPGNKWGERKRPKGWGVNVSHMPLWGQLGIQL